MDRLDQVEASLVSAHNLTEALLMAIREAEMQDTTERDALQALVEVIREKVSAATELVTAEIAALDAARAAKATKAA